jgi:ElaB/YqjD/DUF883 family membrane-anchored ribosome-binding protein
MGEGQRTSGPAVSADRDPEQLRAEIEETRRELGETVAALSAKTDVKARARERIRETRETVQEKLSELEGASHVAVSGSEMVRRNPLPAAVAAALVAGFLFGRLTRS